MNEARPRIGIVVGTTREGRFADIPARWLVDLGSARGDCALEVVDLRDHPLPFYGEPGGPEAVLAVRRWRDALAAPDAYLFLVAEYNHAVSGVLKNALDHLNQEWAGKPVALIGYGGVAAGARAAEALLPVLVALGMAPVRATVPIPFAAKNVSGEGEARTFDPAPETEVGGKAALDGITAWLDVLGLNGAR